MDYCAAKGSRLPQWSKIGSGVNDTRPKLLNGSPTSVGQIVVEHKDRLTRFGFNYIEPLLAMQGHKIETVASNAIHLAENGKEDLIQDFVSIVTSFCARSDGQRRSKRKTERIIAELQNEAGITQLKLDRANLSRTISWMSLPLNTSRWCRRMWIG